MPNMEGAYSQGPPRSAARDWPGTSSAWSNPGMGGGPVPPSPPGPRGGPMPPSPPGPSLHGQHGQIFVKEAQSLVFEAWPNYNRVVMWKSQFYREVVAKSGQDPQLTMKWIRDIEVLNFEELAISSAGYGLNYDSLDIKIATGLWKIVRGEFEKSLQIAERALQQKSAYVMLTGRQIAFRILEHFRLPAGRTKVLTLNHLLAVKMQKDDLRLFNRQWTEIVVQMNPEPDPQILEAIYIWLNWISVRL